MKSIETPETVSAANHVREVPVWIYVGGFRVYVILT